MVSRASEGVLGATGILNTWQPGRRIDAARANMAGEAQSIRRTRLQPRHIDSADLKQCRQTTFDNPVNGYSVFGEALTMKAIPFLLILGSCGIRTVTQRTSFNLDDAVVTTKTRCVDTLRTTSGETPGVAYVFQVQTEVDLRVTEQLGDTTLAIVALTPDDSLSLFVLRWKEAVDITPTTATFSFLVRTSRRGTGFLRIARPGESRLTREKVREAGMPVRL